MNKTQLAAGAVKTILYLFGSMGVLLTILPFLRLDNWWIRVGDFPRLQIAVFCLTVFFAFLFIYRFLGTFEIIFPLLLLACTVYQFYSILPYTPLYPKQVEQTDAAKPGKTIKILISNVLIENKETQRLLDLIEKVRPDLILVCETDQFWIERLSPLKEKYPFAVEKPLENGYGMALYSRLELVKPEIKYLIEDDIPSIHTGIRMTAGDLIRLYGLHPRPPVPSESTDSTERDAELVVVGKEIKEMLTPTIVAGDLNDVAWSRTTGLFQKISGMLDPRIGRGFYNSFHADHWFMRFPLDHVFHTNDFRLVALRRLESIGSDHFPIYIELSLESTAEVTQEEPEADENEVKQANQMIEQAEEKKEGK